MRIREARRSDAQAISVLLADLGYPSTTDAVASRLRTLSDDADSKVFVAEETDVIAVSMTHVFQPLEYENPWCALEAIVVAPEHRRRGIGRALIEAAEREAASRGCDGIVLGTASRRVGAHAFYASLGYQEVGLRFKKPIAHTG
jgi:ribosomal protein S18 acetylase RimI-like enzyme